MSDRKFPKDCPSSCPHFVRFDMSVDDWTNHCDKLNVQIDDCDTDYQWVNCPLEEGEQE